MLEWFKGRGEAVADGDTLCDVEFEEFSFGLTSEYNGFVAAILTPANTPIKDGATIALVVNDEESLAAFKSMGVEVVANAPGDESADGPAGEPAQESPAAAAESPDAPPAEANGEAAAAAPASPMDALSAAVMLHEIKGMIADGCVPDSDVASGLLLLVVNEDPKVKNAFFASFPGDEYAEADFDRDMFLLLATDLTNANEGE